MDEKRFEELKERFGEMEKEGCTCFDSEKMGIDEDEWREFLDRLHIKEGMDLGIVEDDS